MSFVFTDSNFIYEIKEKINQGSGVWGQVVYELKYKADIAMNDELLAVTQVKSPAVSGNPHDYFSEGPYWWPNPQDPDGPYIRRDGEINLARFDTHRVMLEKMCNNVIVLAQAGYFLGEDKYTERAIKQIEMWFLDSETMMNPHLEYGQAIRGLCDGRGIGIIETRMLMAVVHAAGFIAESGKYEKEITGLKEWFAKYLKWLNESKKGIEERDWFNNHSIWWTAQALSFAAFNDDNAMMSKCYELYKHHIIDKQLNVDSAFEDELGRTRSYTYSLFSLKASSIICEIAYNYGVDLWNYETEDGRSLKKSFEFMYPGFENMFTWKYQQISLHQCFEESLAFQLASLRFNKPEYEAANKERRINKYLINNESEIGSCVLFPGFNWYE